jgi:hypothetical protein
LDRALAGDAYIRYGSGRPLALQSQNGIEGRGEPASLDIDEADFVQE